MRRLRFSRPMSGAETEVLRVAAALARESWGHDDPQAHARLQSWSRRLKASYDAMRAELIVPDEGGGTTPYEAKESA
jgi:hypothetical protein